jgi:hypothetical protein
MAAVSALCAWSARGIDRATAGGAVDRWSARWLSSSTTKQPA